MARKNTIQLDYPVKNIEWIISSQHRMNRAPSRFNYKKQEDLPSFLLTYEGKPFIDYFNEKASLLHRLDLSHYFKHYEGLKLCKLELVK